MRNFTVFYIIYISIILVLLAPTLGRAEMSLGEALLQEKTENWQTVENHGQEVDQANRLVRNFSLKEEFNRKGRLIGRERLDGTREIITYDQKGRRVYVWVTSPDGKFEEERLYIDNYLRAILYLDKSIKTLQYLGPLYLDIPAGKRRNSTQSALNVIVSTGTKVRILHYNTYGQLICGYRPDGKKIRQHSQERSNDLDHIIPIDELQFLKQ